MLTYYQQLWDSLKTTGQWEGEIWNRRKNGEVYPEWQNISAVHNNKQDITHYVSIFSDITDIINEQKQTLHLAYYDALTQLPNRLLFNERLNQSILETSRSKNKLGVLFIDLDDFKPVNDQYGHDIGDHLLLAITHRLSQCIREIDTVARLSGDEFVVLLIRLRDSNNAARVAKKMIGALRRPFKIKGFSVRVGCSIGISIYPQDGADGTSLLKQADQAMYVAKQSGKNSYHFA